MIFLDSLSTLKFKCKLMISSKKQYKMFLNYEMKKNVLVKDPPSALDYCKGKVQGHGIHIHSNLNNTIAIIEDFDAFYGYIDRFPVNHL